MVFWLSRSPELTCEFWEWNKNICPHPGKFFSLIWRGHGWAAFTRLLTERRLKASESPAVILFLFLPSSCYQDFPWAKSCTSARNHFLLDFITCLPFSKDVREDKINSKSGWWNILVQSRGSHLPQGSRKRKTENHIFTLPEFHSHAGVFLVRANSTLCALLLLNMKGKRSSCLHGITNTSPSCSLKVSFSFDCGHSPTQK